MNVLFVCYANVGRSQAAMEYYNQRRPGQADSAGTVVDRPGEKIGERYGAASILAVMKEHGIDMSHNERKQLTEAMLDKFDKIIIMAAPQTHPDYLAKHADVEFWDVEDAKDKSIEDTKVIRDQIKLKVDDLISRTASAE